jgi:hypothetical protein
VLEGVALVAHARQPLVGRGDDLRQPPGQDERGEPHAQLVVGRLALDERGQLGRHRMVKADRRPGVEGPLELDQEHGQPIRTIAGRALGDAALGEQPGTRQLVTGEPLEVGHRQLGGGPDLGVIESGPRCCGRLVVCGHRPLEVAQHLGWEHALDRLGHGLEAALAHALRQRLLGPPGLGDRCLVVGGCADRPRQHLDQ